MCQTKTLDCLQLEGFPSKDENPLLESTELENPSTISLQSHQNHVFENPQFVQTLEKTIQIEDTQLPKTPPDDQIEDTHLVDTLNESLQCEIEDDLGFENPKNYGPFSLYDPKPYPVGAGLSNMGNTCFLNAIMQCFIHTVPLVQGIHSLKHDPSIHGDDECCVLCVVRQQIELSLAYSGRVISPTKLVDNLSHISSFFRRYQQEDAHEFLQCLLDKLDSNWLKYEKNANDSSSSDGSLVNQVFGGRLVSQLCCSNCGHNSYTYEPLIDLSLEIEDVNNLESALRSFTKVENIGETEKFTCESCKEQVTGEKQLMLDQTPSVAALHLKRFKNDGFYFDKIDKQIDYPLELDLKPYMKGSMDTNDELKYELYAVVVHVGSSTSGHYFCYIRTAPDTWYRFDDSKVSRVSETTALCQDAYILFYARKGTSWFSTLFEEWKIISEKKIFNTSPKSVLDDTNLPSTSKCFQADLHCFENVSEIVDTQVSTAANKTAPSSSRVFPDESKGDDTDFDAFKSVGTSDNLSNEHRNVEDATATTANDKGEACRISNEAWLSSCVENIIDSEAKHDVGIDPSTPTRSPSPDIYSDDEPIDAAYRIPLNHLGVKDKVSSAKKSLEEAKHDLKRKEALKYMSKSMSGGRRQSLMEAMMDGSSNDSSLNKKRKQASSLQDKQSQRKQVKITPKRLLRPMTA